MSFSYTITSEDNRETFTRLLVNYGLTAGSNSGRFVAPKGKKITAIIFPPGGFQWGPPTITFGDKMTSAWFAFSPNDSGYFFVTLRDRDRQRKTGRQRKEKRKSLEMAKSRWGYVAPIDCFALDQMIKRIYQMSKNNRRKRIRYGVEAGSNQGAAGHGWVAED